MTSGLAIDRPTIDGLKNDVAAGRRRLDELADLVANDPLIGFARALPPDRIRRPWGGLPGGLLARAVLGGRRGACHRRSLRRDQGSPRAEPWRDDDASGPRRAHGDIAGSCRCRPGCLARGPTVIAEHPGRSRRGAWKPTRCDGRSHRHVRATHRCLCGSQRTAAFHPGMGRAHGVTWY